jgi:hypothetical protein
MDCPKIGRLKPPAAGLPAMQVTELKVLFFSRLNARVMESYPPHQRRSDLQSVNYLSSLRPTAEKMEKNLQRICAKSRASRKKEKSCAWLTYLMYQYLVTVCLREEAVLRRSLEASQGQFSFLASQSMVGCQAKRKCFGDAFTFVRDLLLHTVPATRLGPDSPIGRCRHSESRYQRCRVDASDPRRIFVRGSRI